MRLSICATALLVTLGLTGCQSTPKLVQQQQAQAQATEHYLNAQTHLEQLERRFAEAKQQNLARFAPEQVERADDALAEAREEFDDIRYTPSEADESDVEDILLAVNQANIELDSATLIRDTARKVLQPTLEMMSVLEQLGAADPRDGDAIDAAVAKAAFEMDHSRHIAQEVKNLRVMDDEDYEAYLLSVENRLRLLADALDGEDRRNLPMDQQAQSLQRAITELKQLGQSLENDNQALQKAVEQASQQRQQQTLLAEADAAAATEVETTQEVSADQTTASVDSAPEELADTAGTEVESPEAADANTAKNTDSGVTP